MDAALLGAIIIACCFAAGVFETSKRHDKRDDADQTTSRDTEEGNDEHDE